MFKDIKKNLSLKHLYLEDKYEPTLLQIRINRNLDKNKLKRLRVIQRSMIIGLFVGSCYMISALVPSKWVMTTFSIYIIFALIYWELHERVNRIERKRKKIIEKYK